MSGIASDSSKQGIITQSALTTCRELIAEMDEHSIWDHIQSKDLDPRIIEFVMDKIEKGWTAQEICKAVGIKGVASKQWKKIAAYFRAGFRADAEVYLANQTKKLVRVIEKTRLMVEDAMENGTPQMTKGGDIIQVKGATRELSALLDTYQRMVYTPVALWKDYGAIGEKALGGGGNGGGVTIVVKTSVPSRTQEEIDNYRKRFVETKQLEDAIVVEEKKKE